MGAPSEKPVRNKLRDSRVTREWSELAADMWANGVSGGARESASEFDERDTGRLMQHAEDNPILAAYECRHALSTLDVTYHERLYFLLGVAYAIAYFLLRHPDKWKEFIKNPFWLSWKKKPRRDKDREKVLRLVMVFVFSGTSKRTYDRAYSYAKALQRFFNNGEEPQAIPERIKESGGIYKLIDQEVERRRARKRCDMNIDYSDLDGSPDEEDEEPAFCGRATSYTDQDECPFAYFDDEYLDDEDETSELECRIRRSISRLEEGLVAYIREHERRRRERRRA